MSLSLAVCGQAKKAKPSIFYKHTLSIAPLALLDFDNTLLLSAEHRFNRRWAINTDFGYTFATYYLTNVDHTTGFTVRPAARMYFGKRSELFWQAQVLYKQVNYTITDWLGKECVNNVPAYEQFQQFKFRKRVAGLNVMTGEVMPLSSRLFFEISAGLGVRQKIQKVVGEENSCYKTNTAEFPNLYRAKMTTISAPISLRLVYKID